MKKFIRRVTLTITLLFVMTFLSLLVRYSVYSILIHNEIEFETDQVYEVEGINIVKQDISCGYAVIEMLATARGIDLTEEMLYQNNNQQITTSMGKGFLNEMQKQFPDQNIKRFTNLKNSDLISKIEVSLANGNPVPFEFAALYDDGTQKVWTLHFALVTAIDTESERLTIYNPYGYIEEYSVEEFLDATSYKAYEEMETFIKLGFLAGVFNRNTIYIIE